MNPLFALIFAGCSGESAPIVETPPVPEPTPIATTMGDDVLRGMFAALPATMGDATADQVHLGRQLYFDTRFSKNQDISCNTCHLLDKYGVDGTPTSKGHKGQHGDRNAPTVYNAGLQFVQFWDGRAADLEAQAQGPVLNPVEMAMVDEDHVLTVLRSIPGYVDGFKAAFPGEAEPITYANFGRAIGAFERQLVTPSAFDTWLAGDNAALTADQRLGMETFVQTGCTACHSGVGLGGQQYQKLGLVVAYDTPDLGLAKITNNADDSHKFKVPQLRNVEKTGPYFHDGSVATLDDAIRKMGHHQLGKELDDATVARISAFLSATTGEPPAALITAPELPASGPDTPKPDPT